MHTDPFCDDVFTLVKACRLLPKLRNEQPVHVSTLWRWAGKGLGGVRLETWLVGGRRVTSVAALRAFFSELNDRSSRTPEIFTSDSFRDEKTASALEDLGL